MPFEIDTAGNIVTQEVGGAKLPIFVHADGKKSPVNFDDTLGTIRRLNGEAQSHRERAEAAEAAYRPFKDAGIADAGEAAKAIELSRNLKDGDLVTAGKVEEIKAAAKRAAEEQVAAGAKSAAETNQALSKERDSFRDQLYAEKIGGGFSRSKFIGDKIAIPADLMQARFGDRFKIEDGKIVAYDQAGNKIFSRDRPGDLADFDEALETLVDHYPSKAAILKGSGASGGGATSGNANVGGKRSVTRAAFEQMDTASKSAAAADFRSGKAVLVD